MQRIRTIIAVSLAVGALTACAMTDIRGLTPTSHVHAQQTDRPSIHGMLVVGDKTVYLSHLPMFHAPHDYQAIFEVTFNGDVQTRYVADRAKTGEKIYTIVPEPFVLTELKGARKSFKADLVRGHFERGGTPIAEGITVQIKQVVHFRQFQPGDTQPDQFTGLIFGKGSEMFAAHWISAAPDYDQVVAVKPSAAFADPALAWGIPFTVPSRPNKQGLKAGEALSVAIVGQPTVTKLGIGTSYYFETGDLAH